MNEYGLGVVISMRDLFSNTAKRVGSSVKTLDQTVAAASERLDRNMQRMEKGMYAVGAGISALAIPAGLLASYGDTQAALGTLASLGVKDLGALEQASERFTNRWSGYAKGEFIRAAYDVRSALSGLSDHATGAFTANAALTAKATKASIQEMVGAFTTGYGVYKPLLSDLSDMEFGRAFSGAMAQTVKSFKTNGKEMADAIKNLGAVAANNLTPLEEQLAILGTLQTTMPGGESGTLYKSFALRATDAGRKLGLAFTDAQGHMLGIIPILEAIKRRFPDLANGIQKDMLKGAFGDEGFKFVTSMIKGLEPLQTSIAAIRGAMKTGTMEAEKMAMAMNGGIQAMINLLGQQTKNLAEILGKTLVPVFTPIARGASRVLLSLQAIAKTAPNLTQGLLIATAALGSALIVVGGLVSAVGFIGVIIPGIKIGFAAIATAATTTLGAVAAYAWPVTLAFAGLAAVVGVVRAAWQGDLAGIRSAVESVWSKVRLFALGTTELIRSLSNGTGQISADLAKKLQTAGLWEFAVGTFRLFYRAKRLIAGFGAGLKTGLASVAERLTPAFLVMRNAVGQFLGSLGDLFQAFTGVGNTLSGHQFAEIGRHLGTGLAWAFNLLIPTFSLVLRTIAAVVESVAMLVGGLAKAHQATRRFSSRLAIGFYEVLQPIRWVSKAVGKLTGWVSNVITQVGQLFQRMTRIAKAAGSLTLGLLLKPWSVSAFLPANLRDDLNDRLKGMAKTVVGHFRRIPASFLQTFQSGLKTLARLTAQAWFSPVGVAAGLAGKQARSVLERVFRRLDLGPFSDGFRNAFRTIHHHFKALGRHIQTGLLQWVQVLHRAFRINPFQGFRSGWVMLVGKIQTGLNHLRRSFRTLIPTTLTRVIKGLLRIKDRAVSSLGPKLPVNSTPAPALLPTSIQPPKVPSFTPTPNTNLSVIPRLAGLVPKNFMGRLSLRPVVTAYRPPTFSTPANPIFKPPLPQISSGNQETRKPNQYRKVPFEPAPIPKRESTSPGIIERLVSEIAALSEQLKNQSSQPIALNLTTQIDGREVTKTVVENLREQQTRNYQ